MSATKLRNDIFAALNAVYGCQNVSDWHFHGGDGHYLENNRFLTTNILALYAYFKSQDDPYGDSFYTECRNLIWGSYSGGGVAASVARDICMLLNEQVPDD